MKKMLKISLLVFLCFVVLSVDNVFAASFTYKAECTQDEGKQNMDCQLKLTVSENVEYNVTSVNFEVMNLNVTNFTPAQDWYLESSNKNNDKYSYILKTTKTTLEAGTYTIANVHLTKTSSLADCRFTLTMILPTKENRVCTIYQGVYYDKSGKIVEYKEYDKQCNNHVCEKFDENTYFGSSGTTVDKDTYESECGKYCVHEGEKYYGKDGTEVGEQVYNEQCMPKCKIVENEYYGPNGTTVTELEYQKQCGNNVCAKLSDGTMYGKDGKEVNELEYQKQCGNNYCVELSDGTLYGENGEEVDEATFNKQCKDPNYCTFVDNKYYDREGKEVDKTEYSIQCEKHSCEEIANNYFDKAGNLVGEKDYVASCSNHYCEHLNNTYYGKDGNPISKAQYDKECSDVVDNPQTGAFVSILTLLGLSGIGGGIIYFAKKHNRFV